MRPVTRLNRESARRGGIVVRHTLAAGLLAALAGGCGDGGPTSTPDPVTVTVSPASATVGAGGTQSLTASVAGTSDTGVTWTTTGGTIAPSGNQATLTAPIDGGSVTVTATSQAQASASGSATITVTPVSVSVAGGETDLLRGESRVFTASVTGTQQTGVTWSASCGSLDGSGASVSLTAPADEAGPCQVTATSTLNPAVSGTASFQVLPDWVVTRADDPAGATCEPGSCSLRAAMAAVAGGGPVGEDGVAVIRFDGALDGATVALGSALPPVDGEALRILGPTGGLVTLDAAATAAAPRSVLRVMNGASFEARNVAFTGGRSATGGGLDVSGESSVRLVDARIAGNVGLPGLTAGGLAVRGGSTARLENTRVENNRTEGTNAVGGGISILAGGSLHMTGGSISGNATDGSPAGGLYVINAEALLEDVEISGNEARGQNMHSGGFFITGASEATLRDVVAEGNAADGDSGFARILAQNGVFVENAVYRGNRAAQGGAFSVGGDGRLMVSGGSFEENRATVRGGAILAYGSGAIELDDVTFTGNEGGTSGGGAIYATNTSSAVIQGSRFVGNRSEGAGARGGAMAFLPGTRLELSESEVTGNTVVSNGFGGGGLYLWEMEARLENVEIVDNTIENGLGGGISIFDGAEVELVDVHLEGNRSAGAGGAMFVRSSSGSFERVTVRGNHSDFQTGGIQFLLANDWTGSEVLVEGNTSGGTVGGMGIFGSTRLRLERSRFIENEAATSIGGFWFSTTAEGRLDLVDVEVRGNRATSQAGGAAVLGLGEAHLEGMTIADNVSANSVGGLLLANAAAVLDRSSVVGNVAEGAWGGGVHLGSGAEIRNTTISGNRSVTGGGIHVTNGGGTLNGVTLVGNESDTEGGGIRVVQDGARFVNVLASGNTLADGTAANCYERLAGQAESLGHNLSDDGSCTAVFGAGSDRNDEAAGVDPELSGVEGEPRFHELLEGTAAIGGGHPALCLEVDQRGFARKDPCDIGAFEFGGTPPSGAWTAAGSALLRPAPARVPPPAASEIEPGRGGALGGGGPAQGVMPIQPEG
jgi:predicted outer membrane repeat protein